MADVPLRFLDKTANRLYLLGGLDGVDTTGMSAASSVPSGAQVAIDAEVQYGDKAVPVFGVVAVGGMTGTGVARPGQPQNVAAELTLSGDVVVTCDPPANAATVPPWLYVYQLGGTSASEPVSATGTSITFTSPGPGVWTPRAWVISADGVSLQATGASVTIGTPSTTAHTISDASGVVTLDLLADHTYMITPITVTGSPAVQLLDQNGNDFADFDGTTALPVTIPTGTTRVTFAYWSTLAGSIDFEITEAGVQTVPEVTTAPVITGIAKVGEILSVTRGVYADGTVGDYGMWTVQDLPSADLETNVGTGSTLLIDAAWEGHDIEWTQFWRIADGLGGASIFVGPVTSAGTPDPGALGLNGAPLGLNGQPIALT